MKKNEIGIEYIKKLLRNEPIENYIDILNSTTLDLRDKEGRSILFHAVLQNNEYLVKELLKKGAEINVQDNYGWSLLHYAVQEYQPSMAKLLIEHGANVNLVDKNGNSPLCRAVFDSKGQGAIINLLLASGADPYLENNYNISPIKLARSISNYDVKIFFKDYK